MPSCLSVQVPRQVCIAEDQGRLELVWVLGEGERGQTDQLGSEYSTRQETQPAGPLGAALSLLVEWISQTDHTEVLTTTATQSSGQGLSFSISVHCQSSVMQVVTMNPHFTEKEVACWNIQTNAHAFMPSSLIITTSSLKLSSI